ncbi:MAG: methyltransferase domain-containing protein [Candidatus Gracilibacteria bacterium]
MKTNFQDYFRALIGNEEAEQFFCSIKERVTRRSLRANTLRTSKDELVKWLSSQGYEVKDNPFSCDGLDILGRGEELALKLPYHSGFTYPQDSASMFAIDVLDPKPGEMVLDLTAAPGGKSTHIAQRMLNTGVLVANDLDTKRLKALHSNLERLGIFNTVVTRFMPHKMTQYYPETFDKILLDPSCSGEGLLVTPDGKPSFWNEKSLKRYASEQYGLLLSAFRLLKPGGRLVFSTCTLNNIEDEGPVKKLLEKMPEAEILEINLKQTPEQFEDLEGVRFWPHKTGTKGFFCIAITKKSSLNLEQEKETSYEIKTLSQKQLEPFKEFAKDYFGCDLPDAEFTIRDEHLFLISKELANFPLLPFYSLALPFIKICRDEFRPTHAGALILGMSAKKHVYNLNREEVLKVFQRQPITNNSTERGLYIAKYQDFTIGVAKLTDKGVEVVLPHQF